MGMKKFKTYLLNTYYTIPAEVELIIDEHNCDFEDDDDNVDFDTYEIMEE